MDSYYLLIRILTWPLSLLSYSSIRKVGKILGLAAYFLMPTYRKRTLSNLSLAKSLHLSNREIVQTAKASFQNLAITCLEYPRFAREKNFHNVLKCVNPEAPQQLTEKGQGVIFFCAHQANWEALFLDGTSRMKGIAIGKPTKNKHLYRWILSIREKNGGKIVKPKNALKEGLSALKKGLFVGIVGDQGMPNSSYEYPFLGRRAKTSTAPALLAYRTHSPLFFAETIRTPTGYEIRYSDPIWPNPEAPLEEEVKRLMNTLLALLEKSISQRPAEWLWQHNRWKQQTPKLVYKKFRHDSLAVILPKEGLEETLFHLKVLRSIYPTNFITLFSPKPLLLPFEVDEIILYETLEETLQDDFRFKLIFDLAGYPPLISHYKKRSALEVLTLPYLQKLAGKKAKNLSEILTHALCRPGVFSLSQ